MRIIILLALMVLLDVYIYQAIKYLSQNSSDWVKWIWRGSFWLTTVLAVVFTFLLVSGYLDSWSLATITYLRTLVFILYLSKLFFATFLLIDDIRRGVVAIADYFSKEHKYDPSRSRFLVNAALGFAILPFTSLLYGIIRNPYRYKIYESKVPLSQLRGKPLRIVQISDIHSGSFTFKEPVLEAIRMINELQPDLVFFTGDLVNNTADEMDNFKDVFGGIQAKLGIYSVTGNHDYGDYVRWPSSEMKITNFSKLMQTHKDMGWRLLMNEHEIIEWEGQKIAIIGVENYSGVARFTRYGDLKKAYSGCESSDIKLLLSHDPSHWDAQVVKDFKDIDVTFSGHTHGFQFGIEIPGWFKWSPSQFVYKQWAGLYRESNQFLYVNRGLGFIGYPGRVGILPEITLLELHPA